MGTDGQPPLLIVDAANVVGSTPDGWWRDRAGATVRLRQRLEAVAEHGLPAAPANLPGPVEVVLVVEGAARGVAGSDSVRVIAAPASGDDTVVATLREASPDRQRLVMTADRALRERVIALGARVLGPRSLHSPA